jgi:large conductance mechanosensitive channel
MKKLLNEFKEFAMKGNVIELAVGVIIGGAFGKIVSSLVNDIIMPILGIVIGGIDFKGLTFSVFGRVTVSYGNFIQNTVDFLLISLSIFMFIKLIGKISLKHGAEPGPPPEKKPEDVELLIEIRNLLKEASEKNAERV